MFRIKGNPEMVNKTFRLPKPLMDDLGVLAKQESISVNNLVVQCCEYALENMGISAERGVDRKAVDG